MSSRSDGLDVDDGVRALTRVEVGDGPAASSAPSATSAPSAASAGAVPSEPPSHRRLPDIPDPSGLESQGKNQRNTTEKPAVVLWFSFQSLPSFT